MSPWARAAKGTFERPVSSGLYQNRRADFTFTVHQDESSLWVCVLWPNKVQTAFRAAWGAGGGLNVQAVVEERDRVVFHLKSVTGDLTVELGFPQPEEPLLRYTTRLKPNAPLLIPYWPRDILLLGRNGNPGDAAGEIHARQVGGRSGLLYLSLTKPRAGSIFYFQNLTALSGYCEKTETVADGLVGGTWPELGLTLPPTREKALPAGEEFVISDAFVLFDRTIPANEFQMARQFLDSLAQIYLHLPVPETKCPDWPGIAEKTLRDLETCPGCWIYVKGHSYLNAYLSDYDTPPESMVQLAVLLPLLEYAGWTGEKSPLIGRIEATLPNFFDEKTGCIGRWLAGSEDQLDGSEEHKKPRVIDSWYLFHPLLNLSRMALNGNKTAKKLFLGSLDRVIKIAHHFKYEWPVFYDMDTLEVIKAEAGKGKGGEKDVPGLYAHVMLQAWDITREKRYFSEAEKAAKALRRTGFGLMYQVNNTAFSAGAMLRLWKETGKELYLNLSYLCLANIFNNASLWEARYGHGKFHPTFFGIYPLRDAPYTAAYEEQEVFAALDHYIALARGEAILPSVSLLVAECIRMIGHKAAFSYPPMLPEETLAEEVKTGELDPKLWIPIEDMNCGWDRYGEVGQEVYGAGQAFGFLARQYMRIPGESFMVYIDYPFRKKSLVAGSSVSLEINGDGRLSCRMRLISTGEGAMPSFVVTGKKEEFTGHPTPEGHIEYRLRGDQLVTVRWKRAGS